MVWTPFTRADHDRSGQRYASDMTDREWSFIAPFIPPANTGPQAQDGLAVGRRSDFLCFAKAFAAKGLSAKKRGASIFQAAP
jgi:hypothetical protein